VRADLSQRRLLVGPPIQARHYNTARILLVRYGATEGLRTLDTLQLGIALVLFIRNHQDRFPGKSSAVRD
jgi:hypothetical protein